jgi:hypothetical protein
MNENTVVIPLLMAEDATEVTVQTDLGETIVREQNAQHSTEGFAEHGHGRVKEVAPSDQGWRDSLIDAIEQSKPVVTDKERLALDEARERQLERDEAKEEETADEEEQAEESEDAESLANPLEDFEEESVRQWAEYLGLEESDLANPKIAAMLAQQMNSAVEQEQSELRASQTAQARQPGQPVTQQEFDEYVGELHKLVANPAINDPQVFRAWNQEMSKILGDGSPESMAQAEKFGTLATVGAINLMSTVVPMIVSHMLPQALDSVLPGLREMHSDATSANAWADARNEFGKSLPELDSPEFNELREAVVKANPWITEMVWKGPDGKPLHPNDPRSVRQQARAFAQLAIGRKLNPESITKAVETGKKEAMAHNRKVTASRSLSAGRSRSNFARESRNEFLDAINAFNANQHGNFQEK